MIQYLDLVEEKTRDLSEISTIEVMNGTKGTTGEIISSVNENETVTNHVELAVGI